MKQKTIFLSIWVVLLIFSGINLFGYFKPNTFANDWYPSVPFQKGMSFTTWKANAYNTSEARNQYDAMKAAGIEWVAVNIWWFQSNLTSHDIRPGMWTDSYENITSSLQYARSIGLKILYKPMLNLDIYQWRSFIVFTPEWMEAYTNWIVENAKVAEAAGVEIFSIGCELGNMQVHGAEVREMISQIRAVYNGLLTYAANHDSFWFIDWWDAVDIIGVDMYVPMTTRFDPSLTELTSVWDAFYYRLEAFAAKWNRPILFVELGAQARDGSNMVPNDNKLSDRQDVEELRDFYVSLFRSKIWRSPWFKGVYWWIWSLYPPQPDSQGFDPGLPLALQAITEEYTRQREPQPSQTIIFSLIIFGLSICSITILLKRKLLENNQADSEKDSVMSLGILFGLIIYLIFANYTFLLYAGIYSMVSYSFLLGLSTTEIGILFVSIFAASFLTLYLIYRFANHYKLQILVILCGTYPLLTLGYDVETLTLRNYFDLVVLLLVLYGFIESFSNFKGGRSIPDLKKFLMISFLTAFVCIVFGLLFDKLTQGLLLIPLVLLIYMKYGILVRNSQEKSKDIGDANNNGAMFPNIKEKINFRRYSPVLGLIYGILCFFGSAFYNLINFNNLTALTYLLIPVGIAPLFILAISSLNKPNRVNLLATITDPATILVIGFMLSIIGVIGALLDSLFIFWLFLGPIAITIFLLHILLTLISYGNEQNIGRAMVYLFITATFFALGFIINGIKGLVIMQFVFLEFKNGTFVVRESQDPLNFNAPLWTNVIYMSATAVISLMLLIYAKISSKFIRRK